MGGSVVGRLTALDWVIGSIFAIAGVLAVVWLAIVARGVDRHPFLGIEPRNLAEAAAFRDGAAVVRRVQAGEDLERPAVVRAGIIGPEAVELTPLEAAAAQRRPEVIQLLMALGAAPDAQVWRRAWCISGDADVRALLDRHRPADAHPECPHAEGGGEDRR